MEDDSSLHVEVIKKDNVDNSKGLAKYEDSPHSGLLNIKEDNVDKGTLLERGNVMEEKKEINENEASINQDKGNESVIRHKDDCDSDYQNCAVNELQNFTSDASEFTSLSKEQTENASVADELNCRSEDVPDKCDTGKKRQNTKKRGRRKLVNDVNNQPSKNVEHKDSEENETESIKDETSASSSEDSPVSRDNNQSEEFELPPKRRRKKARPRTASLDSDNSDLQPSDLELGYKILEQIMAFPRATPFLDKPDENAYGMLEYYQIITDPMWLNEIDRKYREEEYSKVTELIGDIRRVLENCYRYWGAGDPLSKKALRVEEYLEKKISMLPQSVKQQCTLEATHGDGPGEDSVEDESKEDQQNPETKRYCQIIKKSSFVSKLLRRVVCEIKSDLQTSLTTVRHTELKEIEKDVEDWENSVLLVGDAVNQIYAMWELPVIGHFFYLTFNVLSIEPISQFELERMLLMPQASIMLAKVMTTMLIAPLSRVRLEVGPPMPYSIWTTKLKIKVASWYRIYRNTGDQTLKVFEQIGVEPEFWLVMGETNPLNDCEFHELSFLQRVWLLKSLCDYLLHNHKTIQDVINNIEPDELREKCLGKDKLGYTYHYFSEFSEVRIYKQAKVTESKWYGYEAGVEEVISVAAEDVEYKSDNEDDSISKAVGIKKFLYKPPKCVLPCADNFKLVAASVEDIRCLIDEFCNSDLQVMQGRGPCAPLVIKLNAIVNELEPIERKLISSITYIRNKMYKEWTDFKNRDANYIDPGIAHWEKKEKDHPEKEEKQSVTAAPESFADNTASDQPESCERRERRSKRETQMRFMNADYDGRFGLDESEEDDEEYFEEDDDSEDEWVACPSKRKKKQQNVNKRIKKLNSLTEQIKFQPEQQSNNNNRRNNSVMPPNEIKIKQENIKTEKQDYIRIKSEADLNYVEPVNLKQEPPSYPVIKQEVNVPSQTVVRTLVKLTTPVNKVPIKKSLSPEPEVICISDEDPDSPPDVKPIVDDLRSIKTVDCVVPLVDQRIGPRPQYQQGGVQNQYVPQYPSNSNMGVTYTTARDSNQMYVNSMPHVSSYMPQVRGSPQQQQQQQVIPPVRSPARQTVMYQQSMTSPTLKQSPQSFINNSKSNLPSNSSPQARNNQNFYISPQNSKTISPNSNRSFVNNSSQQQLNKSPVPQQNFIRSPTPVQQRSPRASGPASMQAIQSLLPPSPGRGRPRLQQNIRMQTPSPRGSSVRSMSPQQISNKIGSSPQSILRQRSPLVTQRNVTPQRTPGTSYNSPSNTRFQTNKATNQSPAPQAKRNLSFNSPTRPVRQQPPEPPLQIINTGNIISKNATTVEGKLLVGLTDDGNYGYHVVLPDGGKVTLTNSQLAELRAKNGGSLPPKVGVPMVQSSD
ncbi:uncharacterized protein LOC142328739 isoform X2 [Lycorma delicatula]|uniref:uncharacterized protein LOC142328739 isoform X2 n=1 Tax=Lycorma delicatula TaxID=130591 RepID=UPI003F511C27